MLCPLDAVLLVGMLTIWTQAEINILNICQAALAAVEVEALHLWIQRDIGKSLLLGEDILIAEAKNEAHETDELTEPLSEEVFC